MASYYKKSSGDKFKSVANNNLDNAINHINKQVSQMDMENVSIIAEIEEIVSDMVSAINRAKSSISSCTFQELKEPPSDWED